MAKFDPNLFVDGATDRPDQAHHRRGVERDHRHRGVLGAGTFLFDAQVHTAKGLPTGTGPGTVQEFVERGQFLMLKVDDWSAVYSR